MNRPRRPGQAPPRRRPSGPPHPGAGGGPAGGPRRRSPLDNLPPNVEPKFKVLGTGIDRQMLLSSAQPMELAVIQLATREIEDAYQKFNGRFDEFWRQNAKLLDQVRKLDEVLAMIQQRRTGS